jgi:hypothetical protein
MTSRFSILFNGQDGRELTVVRRRKLLSSTGWPFQVDATALAPAHEPS